MNELVVNCFSNLVKVEILEREYYISLVGIYVNFVGRDDKNRIWLLVYKFDCIYGDSFIVFRVKEIMNKWM